MDNHNNFPQPIDRRKRKGQALKQIDRDLRTIDSGRLGSQRLVINIALDFQEEFPNLSWDDAIKMAIGYYQRIYGA
ncbi:hypothetical protein [Salinivibrio sp. SS2]|uniref:hypothetical protein n=1 Tax=Salinivibrio sp. SS2 TaxID=1892894 RepID=UPI00084C0B76|nr:hypothetical protein [Salinivibrio sp. DV]ODQ00620.1 hypothetical protein BGK46_06105 [Salinivibrio sp. DV]